MPKRKITGLSTPWVGVSWVEVDSDADIVRRVFTFLEDRRVLYEPLNAQLFMYVGPSVKDIREMLTKELATPPEAEQLASSLKEIRAALRKLNTDLEAIEHSGLVNPGEIRERQVLALGEARGRVNPILATLAAKYETDVEDELAAVLEATVGDA
jgi:DNA-binding transcriptional MerR regulator